MGIFSRIKDAIFGHKAQAAEPTAVEAAPAPIVADAAMSDVDVEANLSDLASTKGQDLNWRTSIVDLMKLLDIDSSYDNRSELAQELGRADYAGSAEDNIWLHKAVMTELANNGGRVPADLRD